MKNGRQNVFLIYAGLGKFKPLTGKILTPLFLSHSPYILSIWKFSQQYRIQHYLITFSGPGLHLGPILSSLDYWDGLPAFTLPTSIHSHTATTAKRLHSSSWGLQCAAEQLYWTQPPSRGPKGKGGWNPALLQSEEVTRSNSQRSCPFFPQNIPMVSFLFSNSNSLS